MFPLWELCLLCSCYCHLESLLCYLYCLCKCSVILIYFFYFTVFIIPLWIHFTVCTLQHFCEFCKFCDVYVRLLKTWSSETVVNELCIQSANCSVLFVCVEVLVLFQYTVLEKMIFSISWIIPMVLLYVDSKCLSRNLLDFHHLYFTALEF